MNKRLKQLRNSLRLNQEDFGKEIKVAKTTVSTMEIGKQPITERNILTICETFNVNEVWLRTGIGEMFIPVDTSSLSALKKEYSLSPKATSILENFLKLSDKEQDEFVEMAKKIFKENSDIQVEAEEKESKPELYFENDDMPWAADDTDPTNPEIIHEEIKK